MTRDTLGFGVPAAVESEPDRSWHDHDDWRAWRESLRSGWQPSPGEVESGAAAARRHWSPEQFLRRGGYPWEHRYEVPTATM